jgi:hypothetical protein
MMTRRMVEDPMFSTSTLYELEMSYLDTMSRQQLVEALRCCSHCLPADLTARVEGETTDRLRLFLFAARLIHVLRQLRKQKHQLPSDLDRMAK